MYGFSREEATYTLSTSEGHVYILSQAILEQKGYELIDLTGVKIGDKCRPDVQSAWLAGILNRFHPTLDPTCIVSHVSGPADVFRDLAIARGLDRISSVFPTSANDLVLSQLEAQPWEYVKGSAKILPMYVRALTFPDYHSAAGTLLPPAVALYKRRWISDRRLDGFEEALFFKGSRSDVLRRGPARVQWIFGIVVLPRSLPADCCGI
jgi:hypothetical protein